MIYFVQEENDGAIKIGWNRGGNSPPRARHRLAELQVGNPRKLSLLLTLQGDCGTEKRFHARFAADRIRGEWFRPSPELVEFIRLAKEQADRPRAKPMTMERWRREILPTLPFYRGSQGKAEVG